MESRVLPYINASCVALSSLASYRPLLGMHMDSLDIWPDSSEPADVDLSSLIWKGPSPRQSTFQNLSLHPSLPLLAPPFPAILGSQDADMDSLIWDPSHQSHLTNCHPGSTSPSFEIFSSAAFAKIHSTLIDPNTLFYQSQGLHVPPRSPDSNYHISSLLPAVSDESALMDV